MSNPVPLFEEKIREFTGAKYAATVNNGTAALITAIKALKEEKTRGYAVTTPFTFIATADAIRHAGLKPLFVDIEDNGVNIDPDQVKEALRGLGHKVKMVIPVHLFGEPCRIEEIKEICDASFTPLVEDASQAFGLRVNGRQVGLFGDAGTFSFYASKNMGACGEGGAVITDDEEVYNRVCMMRDHGLMVVNGERVKVMDGGNYRLSREAAYPGLQYMSMHRKAILAELGEKGLDAGYYTRLVYQHPWYREHQEAWDRLPCPNAEAMAEKQRRRFIK